MSDRATRNGKALSLMIVSVIALAGAAALLGVASPSARAATCAQVGTTIGGDWTITSAQVCSGILYTVDGTITINSGGSLTLINGGLSFDKDMLHRGYALTVNTGGSLILDNSIVTVQTTAIDPYLKLALTVNGGALTMQNGAVLKFPGWFNATGATISLSDSAITGFLPGDIASTGVYIGDNDNSPLIRWSSTTAALYDSQIARLYENISAASATNVTGPIEGNVSLLSGSSLYAYDSYIAADFSNVFGLHNEIQVSGGSSAYLYNVTIDQSETPTSESLWEPAFMPLDTTSNIYLLRWARITVLDSTGFPVSGAAIAAASSPSNSPASYPDNGGGTTPSAMTLTFLGKTSTTWDVTDANGNALLPLYTDLINTTSLPNAHSFGNYQLTVTFSTATAVGGVNFNPYPAVTWQDNNAMVTIQMMNVQVRTGPDLALHQSDYPGTLSIIENQPFTVHALVYNQGETDASNVGVAAWLNGSRSNTVASATVATIAAGSFANVSLNIAGIGTPGPHTLELVADPNNTIDEGGALQEANNFANITLNILPPPSGFILLAAPDAGAIIAPGTSMSVSGYVRTDSGNAVTGVTVTVQLVSGSTVLASNTTTTDNVGFFLAVVTVPAGTVDGSYTVLASSSATTIGSDSRAVTIRAPASFLNTLVPLLGIEWWLFLILIAIVIAAAVGITLYFKVYGLGKMVECGECGSFIPEDATVCPRCGVEFEKDMAKCSNCQAWIPVDVKQCPECGVEFATGELDMADYQQKMRLQYDEVVQKLRQDASRQLGRSLSEAEFQEWWRKQPTFVTFEDWLHDEEEMRKQGSKACPTCGTLNSVTAKVCHKCGTLMQAPAAKINAGVKVGAPRRAVRPPSTGAAPGAPPPAEEEEAAPPSGPVVQKRVIKRTPGEGEESTQDQGDQNL